MKAIMIIYAQALEGIVTEAFKKIDIKKYSKIPYMHGAGTHSEPHLDTQVWPGSNEAMLVVTDEIKKTELIKEIAETKKQFLEEGIKAFVWNVEEEV